MRIAFRFDGEFDEALLYTTDVWLRDEDANHDTIMGDSEALGEGSGYREETTTRPLSPPPWNFVSAGIAAPEVGTQLLTRPLSSPPRELVSAGSAAPGWGTQSELDWEASTASTSNNAAPTSEETSTARPPPRVEARSPPTEPRSMRDKGKGTASRPRTEYRDKGKGKAKSTPSLGDRLSGPSSSSVPTARVPLEQRLSNPPLPLADHL
jgi:hypothetical protein